jgi:hypothetical protein
MRGPAGHDGRVNRICRHVNLAAPDTQGDEVLRGLFIRAVRGSVGDPDRSYRLKVSCKG